MSTTSCSARGWHAPVRSVDAAIVATACLCLLGAACGKQDVEKIRADARGRLYVLLQGCAAPAVYAIDDVSGALQATAPGCGLAGSASLMTVSADGLEVMVEGNAARDRGPHLLLYRYRGAVKDWQTRSVALPRGGRNKVALHPAGRHVLSMSSVFVRGGRLATHTLAPDGSLAEPSSRAEAGAEALNILFSADGSRVLTLDRSRHVFAFNFDSATGQLTPVPGSPLQLAHGADAMSLDPSGRYLYVVERKWESRAWGYTLGLEPLSLTPLAGAPLAAGGGAIGIAVHPDGSWLCVVNNSTADLSVYRIEQATGRLLPGDGPRLPTEQRPYGIVIEPSGRFVYVYGAGWMQGFRIDPQSGTLAAVPGGSVRTESSIYAVHVTPARQELARLAAPALPPAPFVPDVQPGSLAAANADYSTLAGALDALQQRDYRLRLGALAALKRLGAGQPEVVAALCERMRNEENEQVRAHVLWVIGELAESAAAAAPYLTAALDDPRFRSRREEVMTALGRIGVAAPAAIPALTEALGDQDYRVRTAAAYALGKVGILPEETRRALVENSLSRADKAATAVLLRSSGVPVAAIPRLMRGLESDAPDARVHAALLLGSLGAAAGEAVPELFGRLRDTEAPVRVAAALALARIRRPGGSPPETAPMASVPGS